MAKPKKRAITMKTEVAAAEKAGSKATIPISTTDIFIFLRKI